MHCALLAVVRLSLVFRSHIVAFLARIRSLNYVVLSLHDLDDFDERRQAEEQRFAPFPWHMTVELGRGVTSPITANTLATPRQRLQ
jgi:hypothetical protein